MRHTTAAVPRQLELVELNGDGDPIGPVVRFPIDWPSAVERFDLTSATLPQAVEAWRCWVTDADEGLLIDVAQSLAGEMVVHISGRAWRATLPGRALGTEALEYLQQVGIDPRDYVAHWCGETWTGDSCGCVDDRCIGHHHDAGEPCGCLPAWAEDFAASNPRPAGAPLPASSTPAGAVADERAAETGELCSCGSQATVVYLTDTFGDVAHCGGLR